MEFRIADTFTASLGDIDQFYDIYALLGTLEDGTFLAGTDLYVSDYIVPQVNLINVPESGNFALLVAVSLGGMLSFVRRKRAARSDIL